MAPKTNSKKAKRTHSDSDSELDSSDDEIVGRLCYSERDTWPKFIVLEASGDRKLTSFSPFLLQKAIKGKVGDVSDVKKLKFGALLIECKSRTQAVTLLESTKLADIKIKSYAHKSLNFSKGIIRDRDHSLHELSVEQIVSELRDQGVLEAKRFTFRKDGKVLPSNTYLLTFDTPNLPERLKVGCFAMRIDRFVPRPIRCFKCQKFGHGQNACRNHVVCYRCGERHHEGSTCNATVKCSNCGEPHMASSSDCPVFKFEAAVQRVKTEQNIGYTDARKPVDGTHSAGTVKKTYAAAIKPVTSSVSFQTDYTWVTKDTPTYLSQTPHQSSNAPSVSVQTSPTKVQQVTDDSKSEKKKNANVNYTKQVKHSDRLPKAQRNPALLFNKFGVLEDMDVSAPQATRSRSHSPKQKDRERSPITPP
ncbi:uncharacterized protein [Haliotis asinina]|uniref:uncharacterized protein n=1 Tax=Haliotis asinina TaxID=109174 RepID=UPI0035320729